MPLVVGVLTVRIGGRARKVHGLTAVEATRTIALRPGRVQQGVGRRLPAQIDAALEAGRRRTVRDLVVDVSAVGRLARRLAITRIGAVARARNRSAVRLAVEAAHVTAPHLVLDVVVTGTDGQRQAVDDVPVHRAEDRPLGVGPLEVVDEANVRIATALVVHRRVLELRRLRRVEVQEAVGAALVAVRAFRNRLVLPLGIVVQLALFPEHATNTRQRPAGRRRETDLVALIGVVGRVVPHRRRRVALVDRGTGVTRALVVAAVHTARVVRVVLDLERVTREVSASVGQVEHAGLARHGQGRVRELVRRDAVVEHRHFERVEVLRLGAVRHLVEDARRVHVLVGLLEQHVPVVVDLIVKTQAHALVRDRVDVLAGDVVVVDGDRIGRHRAGRGTVAEIINLATTAAAQAEIGAATGERALHVVDVATAAVVIDHDARGEVVAERQVQHRFELAAFRAVCGRVVAGRCRGLGYAVLRLRRDVAEHARLGTGAEQSALRTFEDLDALEVGRVDIEVATRDLGRLLVEVDGDVRPLADRALTLRTERTDAETTHVDVALAGAEGGRRHAGQVLHELIKSRDLQFLQRLARQRLDADGNVLQIFRTALGRNDDFFQTQRRFRRRCLRIGHACA